MGVMKGSHEKLRRAPRNPGSGIIVASPAMKGAAAAHAVHPPAIKNQLQPPSHDASTSTTTSSKVGRGTGTLRDFITKSVSVCGHDEHHNMDAFADWSQIGSGAFGTIFRVTNSCNTQVYVAKKISIKSFTREEVAKTLREVYVMKNLQHDNIIRLHTYYVEKKSLCMILEYANEGDLQQYIEHTKQRRSWLPESLLWRLYHHLCSALLYLHGKRIIHRDIKGQNVFLCRHNGQITAKVGDLGLSRAVQQNHLLHSHVGTPAYLAPEQIQRSFYDYKVDVWALGCLFYTASTLEFPFKGEHMLTLYQNIMAQDPQPIGRRYSEKWRTCVMHCLLKDKTKRPDIKQLLALFPPPEEAMAMAISDNPTNGSEEDARVPSRSPVPNRPRTAPSRPSPVPPVNIPDSATDDCKVDARAGKPAAKSIVVRQFGAAPDSPSPDDDDAFSKAGKGHNVYALLRDTRERDKASALLARFGAGGVSSPKPKLGGKERETSSTPPPSEEGRSPANKSSATPVAPSITATATATTATTTTTTATGTVTSSAQPSKPGLAVTFTSAKKPPQEATDLLYRLPESDNGSSSRSSAVPSSTSRSNVSSVRSGEAQPTPTNGNGNATKPKVSSAPPATATPPLSPLLQPTGVAQSQPSKQPLPITASMLASVGLGPAPTSTTVTVPRKHRLQNAPQSISPRPNWTAAPQGTTTTAPTSQSSTTQPPPPAALPPLNTTPNTTPRSSPRKRPSLDRPNPSISPRVVIAAGTLPPKAASAPVSPTRKGSDSSAVQQQQVQQQLEETQPHTKPRQGSNPLSGPVLRAKPRCSPLHAASGVGSLLATNIGAVPTRRPQTAGYHGPPGVLGVNPQRIRRNVAVPWKASTAEANAAPDTTATKPDASGK